MVTITAAGFTLFCFLVLFAHNFERSKIERWSRVRTVIDRPGLPLSAGASQLCAADDSTASLFVLRAGTYVEGLESRRCLDGRLLDTDASGPARSWRIERVRILNGSKAGVEGWVMAYGLMETLQH